SEFRFVIELEEAADVPAVKRPAMDAVLTPGLRVLVVEDNDLNRVVAQALLNSIGAKPTMIGSGDEGVAAAASQDYDVVLMDVQMPGTDGLTATRKIRALDSPRSRVPIVAMTANAMPEDREQCLAAGMDDYIAKPIDHRILRGTLARWV